MRNERDLRIGDRARVFAFGRLMLLANDLVDIAHADLDGLGGGALQLGIERGVDAEVLMRQVLIADALDKLVVDEVDEVRSFAGIDVRRREAERFSLGAAQLRRR